ncbi:hypothetical protein V2J09_021121 [Rumex salicifolius]
MYAQVCTRPNITFVVRMLGRYHTNSGIDHWNTGKKVLRLYKRDSFPTLSNVMNMEYYGSFLHPGVVGYMDSDFARGSKRTIIASSTTKAEFVACFEAII